ncbi:MAG: nicotinate (nicotinamide) nucleotide adenylyltransferase [Planctomycetota bacterium]|nr:nicotinate (nicotinamide) nucleotide adenylyltransferase [Planctomycetota bacterium]
MTVVPVERQAATALERDPIFVVPLEHERRVLVASGLPADRVDTCGPGREGIRRWADRHPDMDRPVILAGLAGGLDPTLQSGTIVVVDEVVDPQGQVTVPPLAPAITGPFERARVATAGRLVCSAEAKLALGRSTGARIVDLESNHFAELARTRGWLWGVLRVVADTAEEAIPASLSRFVDHEGRTKIGAVAREIFQRPSLIPMLRRIGRQSRTALLELGRELQALSLDPTSVGEADRIPAGAEGGPRSILVFGGTFDPPHRGHLDLPFEAARRLGCHEVVFVPARVNPLKQDTPPTPGEDRIAMLEAALADRAAADPHAPVEASVSRVEVDREGPSYMIDTLRHLHATMTAPPDPATGEPGPRPRLRLLIGSDQALDFSRWKDWQAILELAPPAVMPRPPRSRPSLAGAYREKFPSALAGRWSTWTLDLPTSEASSTEVRRRLEAGEPVDDLVSPGVLEVIERRGLYRRGGWNGTAPDRTG